MQPSIKNIHSLHIIRGLAAFIVVIYHAKFILWAGGTLWKKNIGFDSIVDYILFGVDMLSSCGEQCVLIFFLLSGFVIYHSFKHSNRSLRHFFIIRGVRIYIPYLVSLLISILVLYYAVNIASGLAVSGVREYNTRLLEAYNEMGVVSFAKALFFVKGSEYAGFNFVYWSLLHEAIFYLVFPLYFYAGKRWRAVMLVVQLVLYCFTQYPVFYFQLFFLAGMFLYDYYETGRDAIITNSRWYLVVISLLFIATNLLAKLPVPHFANIAALLMAMAAFDYLLAGKKYPAIFKALADMSFSLYLNHLWVLLICYVVAYKYFNQLIIYQRWPYYLSVLATLPVCWLLYICVEKKSLVLISKIKAAWKNKEL